MNLSQMHFYSRAKVAANKPLTKEDGSRNHDIEFWAYEVDSMADGEITDNITKVDTEGQDASGNKFKASVDTTISKQATWFPFGNSNRLTSPDVRRGEEVMIWQFADAAGFFWTDTETGLKLRRLETIIFAISGSPKEDEPPTSENTYFMEFSSHKKAVTFHTSNANGEPMTWDIQLNAGDGNFSLRNSLGDLVSVDGAEAHIELRNSVGSFFDMNKKKLNVFAEEEVNIMSNKITLNGKNAIETTTDQMKSKASNWAIESTTTHTGNLTENGMFQLNGNMSSAAGSAGGDGTIEIGGDVVITKTVEAKNGATFGGTVHAKKIISDDAISAPNV